MSGCCRPGAYERLFSAKQARLDARRYRKRGLGGTSRRLVDLAGDVSGASVLDVGGGVGAIELELLKHGVERATILELSHGYDEEAAALAREARVVAAAERSGRQAVLHEPSGRIWRVALFERSGSA